MFVGAAEELVDVEAVEDLDVMVAFDADDTAPPVIWMRSIDVDDLVICEIPVPVDEEVPVDVTV